MLRNKTCSQHLDTLASDFLHDRGIVHKPPATEWHQVAELPRVNTKFVLILPAEHTHQKTIGGILAAQILQCSQVRSNHGISSQTQSRIDPLPHANHEREG